LPLGLFLLLLGCAGGSKIEMAEVSGKVLYKGKPLTGGLITFISEKGAVPATDVIEENGQYKISAPVGDVKIAVDNRMLEKKPHKGPILKRPDENPGAKTPKGTYVAIPEKYASPDKSGLTYKVVPGSQTYDIPLE
jgi:hypothetical protein